MPRWGFTVTLFKSVFVDPPLKSIIPAAFDARDAWPDCKELISLERDQSACGACWAFAAVSAFNDRLCIATNGEVTTTLSAAFMTSCCDMWKFYPAFGCSGGHPRTAWSFLVHHGIPEDSCYPYPFESCDHSLAQSNSCHLLSVSTPKCPSRCVGNTPIENLYRARNLRKIQGIDAIKSEIMTNGPVSAVLEVSQDFRLYVNGVFSPTYAVRNQIPDDHPVLRLRRGKFTHAVKILGWGSEDGRDFWLVGNSWNAQWGQKGFGKILMRSYGIETEVYAADVDLNSLGTGGLQ